jgi:hypothetical protein
MESEMQVGRGGMGSHKHGVSGTPGRSPRFKHNTLIEAQKAEKTKRRKNEKLYKTASEAIKCET